ncbi:MAG: pyruvate:ferredoxin (flavodoxin) oxidoreductase [Sedimentibacter sp.]
MDLGIKKVVAMDGNEAAAYVAYGFSEVAGIFPITPSSTMAELCDRWAAHGRKNIFNQIVDVTEMQSEAGAAGVVHGSLAAGALTTTFTSSQGLLLMMPNMYKIAGEMLPGVFHVAARAIATHALSIFGDHQDVMATRATGFSMLCSSNAQEVMDLGSIAHLSAIKTSMPFLHFFDGFRTSHEIQKIETISYRTLRNLVDMDAVKFFRERALNPEHPVVRGTAQNPDIYFQNVEVKNIYYDKVADEVNSYMQQLGNITGRYYKPFEYYGSADATKVIVAMGSICDTIHETIDYLQERNEKVGVIKVHLYRPFSKRYFMNVLPDTVEKIAVLDRTKEPGSTGEPLYLDITKILFNEKIRPIVVGGRYGLGSKDTFPNNIISVYNNLSLERPKDNFTIGITDDVSNTSLNINDSIDTTPKGTISAKLWGLGSDGTVGANKTAIKIIGDNTKLYAQAYFSYDSKKSGNITVSHLRFGKDKIRAPYLIKNADYIACHNKSFINKFRILEGLKKGGTFVLNCPWKGEELDEYLPAYIKRYVANNDIEFYIVDAIDITNKIGLGGRINMVMQAAFFKLTNTMPIDDAIRHLKEGIVKDYGHKGDDIVTMNYKAVEAGINELIKVSIPSRWRDVSEKDESNDKYPEFIKNVTSVMMAQEGDELPVSTFVHAPDGHFPLGTTQYEKRGIAIKVPRWDVNTCIQCNQCSYICPHAVIRPFLLTDEEKANAPAEFQTKKPLGKQFEGLHYRIQISPLDCTGCGNCADVCPAPGKALFMEPFEEHEEVQRKNWEFAETITYKDNLISKEIFKGSQFAKPLLEFSGACPGCGETAYVKLITQLFGDRMLVANATGCSSIWGANGPSTAYTTDKNGCGPAWANSLFEDNAEYGLGMLLATKKRREKVIDYIAEVAEKSHNENVKNACKDYLENRDDKNKTREVTNSLIKVIANESVSEEAVNYILENKDQLTKKSQWIFGGDGWAYDIGYGGLDHVLASGENINVLVMDTEVYSNTGGQSSKSTPTAAVAKFASSGKKIRKKDLGAMSMIYGYVYVAQIAIGANMNQAIKAIVEAENYDGPSLIIAYSPCIEHGIKSGMGTSVKREKLAVESGYWHLYRFNPDNKQNGKNPFVLDSKEPSKSFKEFLMGEIRYASLYESFPDQAEILFEKANQDATARYDYYIKLMNA